jgi:hypothetical protein
MMTEQQILEWWEKGLGIARQEWARVCLPARNRLLRPEDYVHTVIQKCLQKPPSLDADRANPLAYLRTMIRNAIIDDIRKCGRVWIADEHLSWEITDEEGTCRHPLFVVAEELMMLEHRLSEMEWLVFRMFYANRMVPTSAEDCLVVGQCLDMSPETVKRWFGRVRTRMSGKENESFDAMEPIAKLREDDHLNFDISIGRETSGVLGAGNRAMKFFSLRGVEDEGLRNTELALAIWRALDLPHLRYHALMHLTGHEVRMPEHIPRIIVDAPLLAEELMLWPRLEPIGDDDGVWVCHHSL